MANEMRKCEKMIAQKKEISTNITLKCHCEFFCKYRLPCKHIFYNDLYGEKPFLNDKTWNDFNYFHEESGVEVWLKDEVVYFEENVNDFNRSKVMEFKEAVSTIQNHFYDILATKNETAIESMMTVMRNVVKKKDKKEKVDKKDDEVRKRKQKQ
jgi:hypothetical protein